jgi:hypothetical protein
MSSPEVDILNINGTEVARLKDSTFSEGMISTKRWAMRKPRRLELATSWSRPTDQVTHRAVASQKTSQNGPP